MKRTTKTSSIEDVIKDLFKGKINRKDLRYMVENTLDSTDKMKIRRALENFIVKHVNGENELNPDELSTNYVVTLYLSTFRTASEFNNLSNIRDTIVQIYKKFKKNIKKLSPEELEESASDIALWKKFNETLELSKSADADSSCRDKE